MNELTMDGKEMEEEGGGGWRPIYVNRKMKRDPSSFSFSPSLHSLALPHHSG